MLAVTSQTLGWLFITYSLPRWPAAISSLLRPVQPAAGLFLAFLVSSPNGRPRFRYLVRSYCAAPCCWVLGTGRDRQLLATRAKVERVVVVLQVDRHRDCGRLRPPLRHQFLPFVGSIMTLGARARMRGRPGTGSPPWKQTEYGISLVVEAKRWRVLARRLRWLSGGVLPRHTAARACLHTPTTIRGFAHHCYRTLAFVRTGSDSRAWRKNPGTSRRSPCRTFRRLLSGHRVSPSDSGFHTPASELLLRQ